MRKYIIQGIIVLVVCFIVAVIYYKNYYYMSVTPSELSIAYSQNHAAATAKFDNKRVEVEGTVKAYYTLMGFRKVMEFKTGGNALPVFCFFLHTPDENTASSYKENQKFTVKGICVGTEEYPFVKGVKINVQEIED